LDALRRAFGVAPGAEVSMELDPGAACLPKSRLAALTAAAAQAALTRRRWRHTWRWA
jgi:hypothetical protein